MKRIYFLVPNIEMTKKIVDDLLLARVNEGHIHVLAERNTPLGNLPAANFLQKISIPLCTPDLPQGENQKLFAFQSFDVAFCTGITACAGNNSPSARMMIESINIFFICDSFIQRKQILLYDI